MSTRLVLVSLVQEELELVCEALRLGGFDDIAKIVEDNIIVVGNDEADPA